MRLVADITSEWGDKIMKKSVIVALAVAAAVAAGGIFGAAKAVKVARAEESLSCSARAALLMDADTGTVVYEKDSEKRLQIASMVKIMTLNLIFEEIESGNLSYDTQVTASEYATSMGGSQAFLDANGVYAAGELIKSIIVASANDSCVAMAEHVAGNVPAFVERMNAKASELGMGNTYFVNCTGLPAPNQYSCAADAAKMMRELIGHNGFFDFSGVWMFDFVHPSGRVTQLSNTNKLVRFYKGCDGGKTGFTSEALSCLSATAKRGDTRFICVVMGAENAKARNAEVSKLLDYGFAHYESKRFVSAGDEAGTAAVNGGKRESVGAVTGADLVVFGRKGEFSAVEKKVEFGSVNAPIEKGDVVGKLSIVRGEETVASCDLLASEDVKEKGFLDYLDYITKSW